MMTPTQKRKKEAMRATVLEPVHPGELLREEFLGPMGITAYRLATDIGVRPPRVYEIVSGKRSITADTALEALPLLRDERELLDECPDPLRPRG